MCSFELNTERRDFMPGGKVMALDGNEFKMDLPGVLEIKEEAQKRYSTERSVVWTSLPFFYKNVIWSLEFVPYKKMTNGPGYTFAAHLRVEDSTYRVSNWSVSVKAEISVKLRPGDRINMHMTLEKTFDASNISWGFTRNVAWSNIRTLKLWKGWASVKFINVSCSTPPPTQGPYLSFYQPEPANQSSATETPPCSPPPAEQTSTSTSSSEEKRGEKRKAAEALSNPECPICMDQYTDPHITPCSHTFCKKCIDSISRNSAGISKCPLCNDTFVPGRCKPNFALKDLLSAQQSNPFLTLGGASSSSSSSLSSPPPVDACFNYRQCRAETKLYCIACKLNICADCHEQYHTKTAFTRSHTLCKKTLLCSTHEEQYQYYCSECKSLACVRCAIESHREHQLSLITFQEHVESRRSEIAALISHFPEDIEALLKKRMALASKIHLLKEREDRVRGEHDSLNALYSEALEAKDDALTLGFEALVTRVQEAAKRKKRK